jgi:hypothetical protein
MGETDVTFRTLMVASAMLAMGCAPTSQSAAPGAAPARPAGPAAEDTCGMANFRHLIGKPAAEIDRASLPPRTRIITPDTMVTQDFNPERLNIMTGTDGRVASMRCF